MSCVCSAVPPWARPQTGRWTAEERRYDSDALSDREVPRQTVTDLNHTHTHTQVLRSPSQSVILR